MLLKDHWDKNKANKQQEKWSTGNTYVNHWDSPTYMASVEDVKLRGGGAVLKQRIWNAAKPILEEWTGQKLKQTSLYGTRVYTDGAVLAPHVDRNPLITSCIINVAQDVDEDWPLEVIDRQGRAVNVTMQPGDMVLYESHSLIHARPFPLKGRFFANTFVHFEPMVDESDSGLPHYIMEGSKWAENWFTNNPGGKQHSPSVTTLQTIAHSAARAGDIDTLLEIAQEDSKTLHMPDENGWQPLHEAVRSGHVDIVHFLLEQGADINARTNDGIGGTPLWWSMNNHDQPHPVVDLIRDLGGLEIGPEL
jgi:prolyl 4-hydroxylase